MESPTPLVPLSFGENPWTSERDMSLQEEDEDSPPKRWFDYFPVCGTLLFEHPGGQRVASLTTLPQ